jgi:hypothetical protein
MTLSSIQSHFAWGIFLQIHISRLTDMQNICKINAKYMHEGKESNINSETSSGPL